MSDATDDQAVSNAVYAISILREPGDRPDRARNEEDSVRVAQVGPRSEVLDKLNGEADSCKVVVAQRRVTHVTRKQHLVLNLAGDEALSIGQRTVLQRRVDTDVVLRVCERFALPLRDAETP